jgi:hypothetical protein
LLEGASGAVPLARVHMSVVLLKKAACRQIKRMIEEMTYIAEHLSNLRQEITDLRNMNARYSAKNEHGPLDQSALELRTTRLLQIKKELSNMLDRPTDPKVWWEKLRNPIRTA